MCSTFVAVVDEVVGGGGGGGGGRVKVVLRGLCHSPQVVVQLQMGRGGEQGSVSQLLVMR